MEKFVNNGVFGNFLKLNEQFFQKVKKKKKKLLFFFSMNPPWNTIYIELLSKSKYLKKNIVQGPGEFIKKDHLVTNELTCQMFNMGNSVEQAIIARMRITLWWSHARVQEVNKSFLFPKFFWNVVIITVTEIQIQELP